jgi:hypothetical protein
MAWATPGRNFGDVYAAFKEQKGEMAFDDVDWNNEALPCIVIIDDEDDSSRYVARVHRIPAEHRDDVGNVSHN